MAPRGDDSKGGGSSDLSSEMTAATPSPGGAPPSAARAASIPPGATLGPFEVLEILGAGGFGEVYRARDTRLGRTVALKVLPEDFFEGEERRARFEREARMLASVNHPAIAVLYSFEEIPGSSSSSSSGSRHVLVMELVEGKTLHASLAKGPLPAGEAIAIGVQIADALGEAHRSGILHRDVKSGNVMLTPRGQVKVLDFGLAKRLEAAPAAGGGPELTREGTTLGTLSYMPPEQLLGKAVDARSDLFSFGVVLYEMVTGRLPFQGSTTVAVADAILHAAPRDFGESPLPARLKSIIGRLLEKDPAKRYVSAEEVRAELKALEASLSAARPAGLSRGARVAIGTAALAAVLLAGWSWQRFSRARWARETAVPEIARLVAEEDFPKAAALARQARAVLPHDPALEKLWAQATIEASAESDPPGADVSCRPYRGGGAWEAVGKTPFAGVRVPKNYYLWRIAKPGYAPVYQIAPTWTLVHRIPPHLSVRLDPEGSAPAGMVRVAGGKIGLSIPGLDQLPEVPLDDYWIDRHEVTNAEYRKFVEAGGYLKREYWKEPFVRDGRTLPWEEAVALFRDATGRPGPAAWELGSFAKGTETHPVAGVSWYEAAAYAVFAGKSLPTVFHWNRAAQTEASLLIVPGSNFSGAGTVPVGGDGAVSGFGTSDMAGNVKEWCWNESAGGKRFILGGGFGEPTYMFIDQDAQSPWDRRANYGFRCARLSAPPPAAALAKIEPATRDFSKEKPVSDDVFRAYKGLYAYDKGPLNARVEETETTDEWTREKVSFDAAYGGERVVAHLYLPRNASPPYQTVIYFPGSGAIHADKFALSPYADFIPRSGRALLAPIFKSTFERRDALQSDYPEATAFWRDHVVMWSKDVGRSIDYLETRKDVDASKLAYVGLSWGSALAPVNLSVEGRFKVAVLESGGLEFQRPLPEADQFNFASRVRIPVLMVNGRYDHFFPVESSQDPLFRLLGTPEKDKKHVLFESGHAPPRKEFIRECLDWLDRYLGPVSR